MTTATVPQQRPAGRPGPASPAPAGAQGWGPLLVVLAGTFMAPLDGINPCANTRRHG